MTEPGTSKKYVLKPKKRWSKLLVVPLVLVAWTLPFAMDRGIRWTAEKKLLEEMEALRRRGEPIFVEDFAVKPVADEENAALVLRAAAKSMDESREGWQKFTDVRLVVPLSDQEMQVIARALSEDQLALTRLRQARGKTEVDWRMPLKRPIDSMLLPDLNQQKDLAFLALGDVVWSHQSGRDGEVVERVKDLLAMSGAVDRLPCYVSHLVSLGMVAATSENLGMIAAALRIGESQGAVSPREVRKLIDEMLDERGMSAGLRNGLNWERAACVDLVRCLEDGTTKSKPKGSFELLRSPLKVGILADARLVPERWSEVVEISNRSSDWPSFEKAVKVETEVMRKIARQRQPYHLSPALTCDGSVFVLRHWQAVTDRRMAAMALAIRCYAVEHEGRLPGRLEELILKYLPVVPLDPMAEGNKPIGYLNDVKRPVLYSAGLNGKDEGGSEMVVSRIEDPTMWDREDVVVHLKRQR